MFRMYFSTFEGKFRGNETQIRQQLKASTQPEMAVAFGPGAMDPRELESHGDHHDAHHSEFPHESPLTMTLPLLILAVPSVLIGLVGTPFNNYFEAFIHPPTEAVTTAIANAEAVSEFDWTEFLIMGGSSVGIGLIGITLASLMYFQRKIDPAAIANQIKPLYEFSLNKWYIDNLYDAVFVKGCRRLARQVLEVDYNVVDGVVNLTGFVTMITGEGLKYFENGRAQFYALIIFVAILGFVIISAT
jgi:NAD(P)H-quinone oxidoreductase subunit 5